MAAELESWHRAKANVENRIKEAKLGLGLDNLPCRGFHANWAYLLITLIAYDLLAWLKLLALPEGERSGYAKRLRFRFIAVAATVGRSGRRLVLPLGRLSAPGRLRPSARAHPRARAGARLTRPLVRNRTRSLPKRWSDPAIARRRTPAALVSSTSPTDRGSPPHRAEQRHQPRPQSLIAGSG